MWYLEMKWDILKGMRMKKITCLLLLLAPLGTSLAGVRFLSGPVADVMEQARRQNRPVLMDFTTDWCRWCDTLDANTYADTAVGRFLAEHVVPMKVDAEKGEGIGLAQKYSVTGYPTILLVGADGVEIDRITGYVPPAPFLSTLQEYLRGVNTFSSARELVRAHPQDPALRYALAKKYDERNDMAGSAEQYKKVLELDPQDRLGHAEEARFSIAIVALRQNNDFGPLGEFVEAHPRSAQIRPALGTLFVRSIRTDDSVNARKFFEQYVSRWPDDASAMNTYAWNCAEHRLNLVQASAVAQKAVAMASSAKEKAEFLDTYATVQFARGMTGEAVTLERQALELLKDATPAERSEFEATLKKFTSAQSTAAPR